MLEDPQPNPLDNSREGILKRSSILSEIHTTNNISFLTLQRVHDNISAQLQSEYAGKASEEAIEDYIGMQKTNAGALFRISGLIDPNLLETDQETWQANSTIWETLVFLGYEVGNINDVIQFLPEITAFIIAYDKNNNNKLFSDKGRERLQLDTMKSILGGYFVTACIGYGALLYHMSHGEEDTPIAQNSQRIDLSAYTRAFPDGIPNPDIEPTAIPRSIADFLGTLDTTPLDDPNDRRRPDAT